jgi:hypothetical protein
MDRSQLWQLVTADLVRARNLLPKDVANHPAIRQYEAFLDRNELELACDMLESYAEKHPVTKDFWVALRDAAAKMKLGDAVARYDQRSAAD